MLFEGSEPLPGYRLIRHLGTGGFGNVWEARDPRGGAAALKFLDCGRMTSDRVANELRQILSLRDVQHPNLIQLFAVSALAKYVVIIMELADGSLADLADLYGSQTRTSIPAGYLLDLLEQAAAALDFLAQFRVRNYGFTPTGLQHCDVKPRNLLLIGNQLKVADFGLCGTQLLNARRRHFIGTPPYAPPELYEGRVTDRVDQYSLAVSYCELAWGDAVFQPRGASRRNSQKLAIDLSAVGQAERMVLARALEPVSMNRWPSCVEFIQELRRSLPPAEARASPLLALPRPQARPLPPRPLATARD